MPGARGGYVDADETPVSCLMPDIARQLCLAFDRIPSAVGLRDSRQILCALSPGRIRPLERCFSGGEMKIFRFF